MITSKINRQNLPSLKCLRIRQGSMLPARLVIWYKIRRVRRFGMGSIRLKICMALGLMSWCWPRGVGRSMTPSVGNNRCRLSLWRLSRLSRRSLLRRCRIGLLVGFLLMGGVLCNSFPTRIKSTFWSWTVSMVLSRLSASDPFALQENWVCCGQV